MSSPDEPTKTFVFPTLRRCLLSAAAGLLAMLVTQATIHLLRGRSAGEAFALMKDSGAFVVFPAGFALAIPMYFAMRRLYEKKPVWFTRPLKK